VTGLNTCPGDPGPQIPEPATLDCRNKPGNDEEALTAYVVEVERIIPITGHKDRITPCALFRQGRSAGRIERRTQADIAQDM
jgi:hypothetical protein